MAQDGLVLHLKLIHLRQRRRCFPFNYLPPGHLSTAYHRLPLLSTTYSIRRRQPYHHHHHHNHLHHRIPPSLLPITTTAQLLFNQSVGNHANYLPITGLLDLTLIHFILACLPYLLFILPRQYANNLLQTSRL